MVSNMISSVVSNMMKHTVKMKTACHVEYHPALVSFKQLLCKVMAVGHLHQQTCFGSISVVLLTMRILRLVCEPDTCTYDST